MILFFVLPEDHKSGYGPFSNIYVNLLAFEIQKTEICPKSENGCEISFALPTIES